MFRRLGTILSCLALFLVAGGHWAVLQSVAWAGMIESYARADGFTIAVQKTFSGNFPCTMCHRIDEQKKDSEQTPLAQSASKKIEGIAGENQARPAPPVPRTFSHPWPGDCLAATRSEAPPVPVPILS